MNKKLIEILGQKIQTSMAGGMLSPDLKKWAQEHSITPKRTKLAIAPEFKEYREFWLVTDHIGRKDSSHRVVFDDKKNIFGLEGATEDGTQYYLGEYGEFHEAIYNM